MSFNIFLQDSKAKKYSSAPRSPEPEIKPEPKPEKVYNTKPTCRDHQIELSMVCFDCVQQICLDCVPSHQDHNYKKTLECKQDLIKKLNRSKDDILDLKESFNKTLVKIQVEKSENDESAKLESQSKIQELLKEKSTLEEEIIELKQYLEEKRLKLLDIDQDIRIINQKSQFSSMNASQKKMDDLYVEEKEAEGKVKRCNNILDETEKSVRDGSTDALLKSLIAIHDEMKTLAPQKVVPLTLPKEPYREPQKDLLSPKREPLMSPKPKETVPSSGKVNDTPNWMQNIKKRDIMAVTDSPKEPIQYKPVKGYTKSNPDPEFCSFKGISFEGGVNEDLVFELTARNSDGEIVDVDVKSLFKFRLLDYPEDCSPKIKVKTRDQPIGTIGIIFSADKPATYVVLIEYEEQDITGSPFSIVIGERQYSSVTSEPSFELPVICHYAGGFNPKTQEFMIKPNVMSNTVYCFDLKKNPTRTFDLPIVAWSLCADTDGNIYCGDNKKNFYKFDSKFNQIWSTQVDDKYALGVYIDNTHVYGLLHKGPIFKMDIETGKVLEKIEPSVAFTHAFNFVIHKNFLIVGDKKDLMLYSTQGMFISQINGFDNCAFAVLEGQLYICVNKSTKWIRLDL
jgi:hypothetical protein